MKILNELINVMAIFNIAGKIKPVKFKLYDKVVNVENPPKYFLSLIVDIHIIYSIILYIIILTTKYIQ